MYILANTNVVYCGRFCSFVNIYVHSLVHTAIRVGLGPVKSSGNEKPITCMCDVSCLCPSQQKTINASMILYEKVLFSSRIRNIHQS